MKIPKNYFDGLSASKYREYLKLLPKMQHENTRIVTTLIFTFLALSFFGIFAIKPTLSTIVTLRKQLADGILVHESLKTKITNLSRLQQQYSALGPDLVTVLDAIPNDPKATTLIGQISEVAKSQNVKIISLEATEIVLTNKTGGANQKTALPNNPLPLPPGNVAGPALKSTNNDSYRFALKAQGNYEELITFAKTLSQINRLIVIDSLTASRDPKQNNIILELGGRVYFKK